MPPENRTESGKAHDFAVDETDDVGMVEEMGEIEDRESSSSDNSSNVSSVVLMSEGSSTDHEVPYIGDVLQTDRDEALFPGEDGSESHSNCDTDDDGGFEKDTGNASPLHQRPSIAPSVAVASLAAASIYAWGKRRQVRLTKPPVVLGQIPPTTKVRSVYERLTRSDPAHSENQGNPTGNSGARGNDIWSRPIVPSLFVGTRGSLASAAAHLSRGPLVSDKVLRFSESFVSSHDGATLRLLWEVPDDRPGEGQRRKRGILGSARIVPQQQEQHRHRHRIEHPTAVIVHGINHSSDTGCVRSLQRTLTDMGWNAVAVNLRGCGPGSTLSTPRSYTAAYTGDLRSLIRQLSARAAPPPGDGHHTRSSPLLLVGCSLGANLLTKYLGEEGLAGTLPEAVRAGVALANPFGVRSENMRLSHSLLIGRARKAHYRRHRSALAGGTLPGATVKAVASDPRCATLAALDAALAPHLVRNAEHPPYETRVGYGHRDDDKNDDYDHDDDHNQNHNQNQNERKHFQPLSPEDHYWNDCSSFRQGRHVSVPFLHVQARDDSLCFAKARHYLGQTLQNPNVLWVETECGGHLGWWHSDDRRNRTDHATNRWGGWPGKSWAHDATAEFFRAVLEVENDEQFKSKFQPEPASPSPINDAHVVFAREGKCGNRANGNSEETERNTLGTSERCLAGDDNSTLSSTESIIATIPGSTRTGTLRTRQRPQITRNSAHVSDWIVSQPVMVRIQYQQYVSFRNGSWNEEQLQRNKHLERDESIRLSRRLRSRL